MTNRRFIGKEPITPCLCKQGAGYTESELTISKNGKVVTQKTTCYHCFRTLNTFKFDRRK